VRALHAWVAEHGVAGLRERLFDAGETDYSSYAEMEPDFAAVDEAGGLFLWRGRPVRVLGPDRFNPTAVLDADSKEVLWDLDRETVRAAPPPRPAGASRAVLVT
jgi:hypothetical protein